jgi:DNA invertase Pin-like site-specific DNA recombinase
MLIGYARVSTDEQNLALQLDALRAVGCEAIFEDTASGASARKGLADALGRCAVGDVLVAWKLDRLGRSMPDLVNLVETLKAKGCGLKVLTGSGASIDTTRPEGRFVFGIFAALAEFERELIRERTREGMQSARRRGVRLGRPPGLTPEQVALARQLTGDGIETKAGVAALLGCGVSTLRRALKGSTD